MVHVRRKSPSRATSRSALIARDHVAKSVVLDSDVRALFQMPYDRIANRIFVEWRRRLFEQRPQNAE